MRQPNNPVPPPPPPRPVTCRAALPLLNCCVNSRMTGNGVECKMNSALLRLALSSGLVKRRADNACCGDASFLRVWTCVVRLTLLWATLRAKPVEVVGNRVGNANTVSMVPTVTLIAVQHEITLSFRTVKLVICETREHGREPALWKSAYLFVSAVTQTARVLFVLVVIRRTRCNSAPR
jgi:hypothetical protein